MTFHALKIGEMFEIRYEIGHGLSVKLTDKTALDLCTGQICPVHFNKKIETPGSLNFSKDFFLAWHKGSPVIVRKSSGGFEIFRLLITKSELVRDALDIQGIPYGSSDEIDIILSRMKIHLQKSLSLADTLATLREHDIFLRCFRPRPIIKTEVFRTG